MVRHIEKMASWVLLLFLMLVVGCSEPLPESTEYKCPCDEGWTCMDNVCRKSWTDPTSGLTWQVTPTGGTMDWSDAMSHCAGLSLDGGGWHLPTTWELRALIGGCPATEEDGSCNIEEGDCLQYACIDDSCIGCSDNGGPADGCFWAHGMPGDHSAYWSSSLVEGSGDEAWTVGFYTECSYVTYPISNGTPLARCVR